MKRLKHKFNWSLNEIRFRGLFAWLFWLWFIHRIVLMSTKMGYMQLHIKMDLEGIINANAYNVNQY